MFTAGQKSPHKLWISSNLKIQPINTILDTDKLQHLSEWQSMPPASVHEPIVNPPFHVELNMEQHAHISQLKTQLQTNESR